MKKLLIAIVLMSLFIGGCKKVITEVPYDFLTPQNFPTSAAEADAALIGCYTALKGTGNGTWNYTGGLYMNTQNDVTFSANNWSYFVNASNATEVAWWKDYWVGINAANNLIGALERRDATKDFWIPEKLAEARAIRAYFYHTMATMFGDLPLRMKPTTETVLKVPRSPVQAIYDSIILPDIAYADGKLPVSNSASGRITAGPLKCIMADIYMKLAGWRRSSQGQMVEGNPSYWAKARDAAKAVIDMEAAGVYELEDEYSQVFTKLSTDVQTHEVILAMEFTQNAGSNFPYAYGTTPVGATSGGGGGNLRLLREWLRTQSDQDERWKWNVGDYTYSGWTKVPQADTGVWRVTTFQKIFPSKGYWQDHLTDWPLYRLAEAKLMYAEAANEAEGGPSAEAYQQLNAIRYRARPADHKNDGTVLPDLAGLTQQQFREAVWNERAMELINEGKRRMDLIRWNVFKERIEAIQQYESSLASVGGFRMRYFLCWVPSGEVAANDWQNNEGY